MLELVRAAVVAAVAHVLARGMIRLADFVAPRVARLVGSGLHRLIRWWVLSFDLADPGIRTALRSELEGTLLDPYESRIEEMVAAGRSRAWAVIAAAWREDFISPKSPIVLYRIARVSARAVRTNPTRLAGHILRKIRLAEADLQLAVAAGWERRNYRRSQLCLVGERMGTIHEKHGPVLRSTDPDLVHVCVAWETLVDRWRRARKRKG